MDTVEALKAEVARCHERLGLTRCCEMVDGEFVERVIPMEKRADWPDAVYVGEVREHCLKEERDEAIEQLDKLFDAAKAVVLTMRKARNGTLVDNGPIVALAELVLEMAETDEDEDDAAA